MVYCIVGYIGGYSGLGPEDPVPRLESFQLKYLKYPFGWLSTLSTWVKVRSGPILLLISSFLQYRDHLLMWFCFKFQVFFWFTI